MTSDLPDPFRAAANPFLPPRASAKVQYYVDTEDFLWKKLVAIAERPHLNPLDEAAATEWRIQTRNDRSSRSKRGEGISMKCVFPPVTGTYVATSTKCDGGGLFAGRDFRAGEQVAHYVGELLNRQEAEARENKQYLRKSCVPGFVIDARHPLYRDGHQGAMVNTSTCKLDINCRFVEMIGHFPTIITRRPVLAGEEFIVSYGVDNLADHHGIT